MNPLALHNSGTSHPGTPAHSPLAWLTQLMYALHTLSWLSLGVFSVLAMVLNYAQRSKLPDHFYRSHFRWQSRSFWLTLAALTLTAPLWLFFVFPGYWAWSLVGLWYLYRFLKGWWYFAHQRPMPVDTSDMPA